jgi:hypothetical protein
MIMGGVNWSTSKEAMNGCTTDPRTLGGVS